MNNAMLPGYEPSKEDLYRTEIRKPLEVKIREAIELLQLCEENALEASPDGYYLCFSGGKDSCVIKELAKMAGVKFTSHYSVTTIDPPELVRFIKREHPDVIWQRKVKEPLPLYMAKKGFPPTRMARWCCEIYKESGNTDRVKMLGVRAAESTGRKSRWLPITMMTGHPNIVVCPIVYWTDEDVFGFAEQQNIPLCELYKEGFSRLGCIGCPLTTQSKIESEFARWPGYEKLWKLGFEKMFKNFKNTPRKDGKPRAFYADKEKWEDIWDWWITGVRKQKVKQCQMFEW